MGTGSGNTSHLSVKVFKDRPVITSTFLNYHELVTLRFHKICILRNIKLGALPGGAEW